MISFFALKSVQVIASRIFFGYFHFWQKCCHFCAQSRGFMKKAFSAAPKVRESQNEFVVSSNTPKSQQICFLDAALLLSFSSQFYFLFWLTKVIKSENVTLQFVLSFFIFVFPVLPCKQKTYTENHTTYFYLW